MTNLAQQLDNKIDISGLLLKVDLFQPLVEDEKALKYLAQCFEEKFVQQGEMILEEGKEGNEMFILTCGTAEVSKKTFEGDNYKVALRHGEDVPALGVGGIVSNEKRTASITCLTNCDFLVLSREKFEEFSQKFPGLAIPIYQNLIELLTKRVKRLNTDLTLLHQALTQEIKGS